MDYTYKCNVWPWGTARLTPHQEAKVTELLKAHPGSIVEKDGWSSGGGHLHDLFRMSDGIIYTVHITEELVEKSHEKWSSIEDYLNTAYLDEEGEVCERGFGWETEAPDYESRNWEL